MSVSIELPLTICLIFCTSRQISSKQFHASYCIFIILVDFEIYENNTILRSVMEIKLQFG